MSLAAYYNSLDVINRGVDGYNTAWSALSLSFSCTKSFQLIDRYLRLMVNVLAKKSAGDIDPHVRLVTIWFGQ